MTTRNEITLPIHTNNFMELNKRLLLQPITFKAVQTDYGCDVTIKSEDGVEYLIHHLTDTISEILLEIVVEQVFVSKGAFKGWAKHRLVSRLNVEDMVHTWREDLKEEITHHVNMAIKHNNPLKLSAYINFGSVDIRKQIEVFAETLEELTYVGAIERTVHVLGVDNISDDLPNDDFYEIRITRDEMLFMNDFDENGEPTQTPYDFQTSHHIVDTYVETIYRKDSERYRIAQMYTFILYTMRCWGVRTWIVPEEHFEALESYRQRLDIPVEIQARSSNNPF